MVGFVDDILPWCNKDGSFAFEDDDELAAVAEDET